MAKNEQQNHDVKKDRRFAGIIKQINNIMGQSNLSLYGTDRESEVERLDTKFHDLMKTEIRTINGRGEGDPGSLLTKLWDSDLKGSSYLSSVDKQFMSISADDASVMANFVQEMHKNRFTMHNDLSEVANALIELSESIEITRDAIVAADVVEGRIARTLNFEVNSDDTEDDLIPMVEQMERKFNLLFKIKNFVIPLTLEYGEYYAYVIPYSKLFEQFTDSKNRIASKSINPYGTGKSSYKKESTNEYGDYTVYESVITKTIKDHSAKKNTNNGSVMKPKHSDISEKIYKAYYESTESLTKDSNGNQTGFKRIEHEEFVSDIDNILDRVSISNDIVPLPLLESGVGAMEALIKDKHNIEHMTEAYKVQKDKKPLNKFDQVISGMSSEAIQFSKDAGSNSLYRTHDGSKKVKSDFSDITDCYIKFYDPTKIVPVKIMDTTIGYYIVLSNKMTNQLNGAVSQNLFYTDFDENRRCERTIVDQIADAIVSSFDKEFLKDNLEFKNLIVEAITHYNLNENRIKFQFVPCEYMQEFKIDQDADGNGQSMIKKSLFYAKLYLMLLLFKIMSIIQNSNDTRVNYIRSSGIDKDLANKVQEIARMKQARKINMADLFNYTTLINKVGMGDEMYVPTGRSNERPMETEILSGQDIQLDTPLLEMLKNSYILGTGVPAAILNYLHEADFSKTQELNNTKFNGRVVNYQLDFNDSITELYKKIMRYSTNIQPQYIDGFTFILQPPKSQSTSIKNEMISNFTSVSDFVAQLIFGDNSDGDINVTKQIAHFKRLFAEEQLPMLNWDKINELTDEAKIRAAKELVTPDPNNGDSGDDIGLDLDSM